MIVKHSKLLNTILFLCRLNKLYCVCSNDFVLIDANGDGKITFAEWRDSTARTILVGADDSALTQYWDMYDTANAGYLTEDEATNILA